MCPGCAGVQPLCPSMQAGRKGAAPRTRLNLGGSQSLMSSGCTTASVTTSAMLMVPRMATTTALRSLQAVPHQRMHARSCAAMLSARCSTDLRSPASNPAAHACMRMHM